MVPTIPCLNSKMVTIVVSDKFVIKLACIFYLYFFTGPFSVWRIVILDMFRCLTVAGSCGSLIARRWGATVMVLMWSSHLSSVGGAGHVTSERLCHTALYGLFSLNMCSHPSGCSAHTAQMFLHEGGSRR